MQAFVTFLYILVFGALVGNGLLFHQVKTLEQQPSEQLSQVDGGNTLGADVGRATNGASLGATNTWTGSNTFNPGPITVTNGVNTTTIARDSLNVALGSGFKAGRFAVDSSGNVTASGTLRTSGLATFSVGGATGSDQNFLLGGGGALQLRSSSCFLREASGLQITCGASPVYITTSAFGVGVTSPSSTFHVSSGSNATTTISNGILGDVTSKTCWNAKNSAGANIRIYFVGTTQIVETGTCT